MDEGKMDKGKKKPSPTNIKDIKGGQAIPKKGGAVSINQGDDEKSEPTPKISKFSKPQLARERKSIERFFITKNEDHSESDAEDGINSNSSDQQTLSSHEDFNIQSKPAPHKIQHSEQYAGKNMKTIDIDDAGKPGKTNSEKQERKGQRRPLQQPILNIQQDQIKEVYDLKSDGSSKEVEGKTSRILLEISDLDMEMKKLDKFFTKKPNLIGMDLSSTPQDTYQPVPLQLTESDSTEIAEKLLKLQVLVKPKLEYDDKTKIRASSQDMNTKIKEVSSKPKRTQKVYTPAKPKPSKITKRNDSIISGESKLTLTKLASNTSARSIETSTTTSGNLEAFQNSTSATNSSAISSVSSVFLRCKPPSSKGQKSKNLFMAAGDDASETDEEFEDIPSFSSDESGENHKPDMSWITGCSEEENDSPLHEDNATEPEAKSNVELFPGIRRLLQLVIMLGRYPFVIYVDESGTFQSKIKKKLFRLDFILITSLMLFSFLICIGSTSVILISSIESNSQYENFEKLLMQKHWLYISLFLLNGIVAVIGNLSIMFQAKTINKFFNDVGKSLEKLKYRSADNGFILLISLYIGITIIDVVIVVCLVGTNFMEFGEKQRFLTMMYMRWIYVDAFRHYHMFIFKHVIFLFEIYIYFSARNLVVLILIFCQSVVKVAQEWNFRLAILLRKATANQLRRMSKTLSFINHERLVTEHLIITNLVKQISARFPVILSTFFITRIFCICCELFKLASTILFDLKVKVKTDTVENTGGVKYESADDEKAFEVAFFLATTFIFAFLASKNISDVGDSVMNGFGPIRRHGLMLANSLTERKFVMTMYMSFNGKSPHLVKPGAFFAIDKGHILRILGSAMLVVSIMIQCQVVNLIEIPIALPCSSDAESGICTKTVIINDNQQGKNPSDIIDDGGKNWASFPPPANITIKTSPTGTTSTRTSSTRTTPTQTSSTRTTSTRTTPTQTSSTQTTSTRTTSTPTTSTPTTSTRTTSTQTSSTRTTPIRTTATPTTSTTMKAPKNCNDPVDESKFLNLRDKREKKKAECGFYCPLTQVYRISPRDEHGTKLLTKQDFKPNINDILECIGNPYEKFRNQLFYDCFGNCRSPETDSPKSPLLDPLRRYSFSLYRHELKKIVFNFFKKPVLAILAGVGQDAWCYHDDPDSIDRCHPLEYCGVPFAYVGLIKDNKLKTSDLPEVIRTTVDEMRARKFGKSAYCILNAKEDPTVDKQIVTEIHYKHEKLYRLRPFSFAYEPTGRGLGVDVPLSPEDIRADEGGIEGKQLRDFAYPYTYIHPKLTSQPGSIYTPFGYFDCFGTPLTEFDDCGGLPFTVIRNSKRRPPTKVSNELSGTLTGHCWESWIPGYVCGVPEANKSLREELCNEWKNYLGRLP